MEIVFLLFERNTKLEAGMLVKRENGEIELVGHININEGYCDCCFFGEIVEYSSSLLNNINETIKNENIKTGFLK